MVLFESMSEQILSHVIGVHLHLWVDAHYIVDKLQISEWDTRLDAVVRDAPVRAKDIIHVQLVDTLLGLRLESLRRRRKVCVLVAEQFVGNLSGQQNTHICLLMNRLAAQIHAHACADRRDIPGSERLDDRRQIINYLLRGHIDLRVLGANVVSHLPRIFQIYGILVHPDCEGPNLFPEDLCGYGADQR